MAVNLDLPAPSKDDVLTGSKCFRGCFDGTIADGATVYLLNQIRQALGGGTMTAQEVRSASKCWCFTGSDFTAAATYLLAQIEGLISGTGSSANPIYNGATPPASPAFPASAALFVPDNDANPFQVWIPGTGWTIR